MGAAETALGCSRLACCHHAMPSLLLPNPCWHHIIPTATPQGEHMHHGYDPRGGGGAPKTNQQAQVDMIEETLKWAGAEGATKVRCAGVPRSISAACVL